MTTLTGEGGSPSPDEAMPARAALDAMAAEHGVTPGSDVALSSTSDRTSLFMGEDTPQAVTSASDSGASARDALDSMLDDERQRSGAVVTLDEPRGEATPLFAWRDSRVPDDGPDLSSDPRFHADLEHPVVVSMDDDGVLRVPVDPSVTSRVEVHVPDLGDHRVFPVDDLDAPAPVDVTTGFPDIAHTIHVEASDGFPPAPDAPTGFPDISSTIHVESTGFPASPEADEPLTPEAALSEANRELIAARNKLAEVRAGSEARTVTLRKYTKRDLKKALSEFDEAKTKVGALAAEKLRDEGYDEETIRSLANVGAAMEATGVTRKQFQIEVENAGSKKLEKFYSWWHRNSQDPLFSKQGLINAGKKAAFMAPVGIVATMLAPIAATATAGIAGGFAGTRITRGLMNAKIGAEGSATTVAEQKAADRERAAHDKIAAAENEGRFIDQVAVSKTYRKETRDVVWKKNRARAAKAAGAALVLGYAGAEVIHGLQGVLGSSEHISGGGGHGTGSPDTHTGGGSSTPDTHTGGGSNPDSGSGSHTPSGSEHTGGGDHSTDTDTNTGGTGTDTHTGGGSADHPNGGGHQPDTDNHGGGSSDELTPEQKKFFFEDNPTEELKGERELFNKMMERNQHNQGVVRAEHPNWEAPKVEARAWEITQQEAARVARQQAEEGLDKAA